MQISVIVLAAFLVVIATFIVPSSAAGRYQPTWDSLDKRPLPKWYDEAKFGIFIHWGVFSVPAFGSEWFWNFWRAKKLPKYVDFMKKNYPPGFTYADFASQFTAELYDPNYWADVIQASGAKYVVLTSKHHEGFTNWPSNVSFNWNAMEVGPKRDFVGELASAIRSRTKVKFGLYHSLFEWFNPLFLNDQANKFKTRRFAAEKSIPELYEIVNAYKPEVIWSDGAAANWTYWNSTDFIAWLYNDSPVKDTVVTNDRWGDTMCKHGDFYTCQDRYNPGHLVKHKWENAMTIDRGSWGYRRDTTLNTFLSMEEIIQQLVTTVSCGGNLLMNFGPTHDGRIIPIFEERMRQMGSWLKVNGEAIYGTTPWKVQNDSITPDVWFTSKKINGSSTLYAISLRTLRPRYILNLPQMSDNTVVTLLGYPHPVKHFRIIPQGIDIYSPNITFSKVPSKWAWVFKMTNTT